MALSSQREIIKPFVRGKRNMNNATEIFIILGYSVKSEFENSLIFFSAKLSVFIFFDKKGLK